MKTAVVIGGSGGIGQAIVKQLADAGFLVHGTYHTQQKESRGNIMWHQVDICSRESVAGLFQEIYKTNEEIYKTNALENVQINEQTNTQTNAQEWTGADVIVYCPTVQTKHKQVLSVPWEDIQQHLDTQVKGLWHIVQSMEVQLREKRPLKFILLLTEYCLGKPPVGVIDYITAKYSLMGMGKSLAVELAKYNCTVNMIAPGMVDTPLLKNLPPKLMELTAEQNPLKRLTTPQDVAHVVNFLASDAAADLNGVIIPVNGGGVML